MCRPLTTVNFLLSLALKWRQICLRLIIKLFWQKTQELQTQLRNKQVFHKIVKAHLYLHQAQALSTILLQNHFLSVCFYLILLLAFADPGVNGIQPMASQAPEAADSSNNWPEQTDLSKINKVFIF